MGTSDNDNCRVSLSTKFMTLPRPKHSYVVTSSLPVALPDSLPQQYDTRKRVSTFCRDSYISFCAVSVMVIKSPGQSMAASLV